jgi:hypothetical protein
MVRTLFCFPRSARLLLLFLILAGVAAPLAAQKVVSATPVPQTIPYSGQLPAYAGQSVRILFALYSVSEGGEPLWTETQDLRCDHDGRFAVLLGSNSDAGLPPGLFLDGQPRWVAMRINDAPESLRTQLHEGCRCTDSEWTVFCQLRHAETVGFCCRFADRAGGSARSA